MGTGYDVESRAPITTPIPTGRYVLYAGRMEHATRGHLLHARARTSITAKGGDIFVIQLGMNPSTGYQWQLTPKGDPGVTLKSSKFVKDSQTSTGTETAVGVGGVENWTFTAEAAGTGTLAFGSIAPGKYTPVETVTFNVTVTS